MSSFISKLINLAGNITGVLPIANGGTNSSTTLNNKQLMISSSGAIVEAGALINGQLFIGNTSNPPSAAVITGTANQITVTNGAGTITLSLPTTINTKYYGNIPSTYIATSITMSSNNTNYSPASIASTNSSDGTYITSVAIAGGGSGATNGTWTITFARIGYYLVSTINAITGGTISVAGQTVITMALGGTATLLSPDTSTFQTSTLIVSADVINSVGACTLSVNAYVNVTSGGQTLTINPYGATAGNNGAAVLRSYLSIEPK